MQSVQFLQFLLFHLGQDRYGLRTRDLVSVLPLMVLKQLPQAPAYVAGLMNLHGAPVPVIDINLLACNIGCSSQFDSRILLTEFPCADGSRHLLGLMVERVSHIAAFDPSLFVAPGVTNTAAPYLGEVVAADGALVQLVELAQLLTAEVQALLFTPAGQTPELPC